MQIVKFDKAKLWLEKNAKDGDASAYPLLAEIYTIEENFSKAKYWAKKAINNGSLQAKELWDKYKLKDYE